MNPGVRSLAAVAALFAAGLLPAHAELDAVGLKKAIETSIASDYPKLDALYKELHAHPELAFQEVKTAARLAASNTVGNHRMVFIVPSSGSDCNQRRLRWRFRR